MEIIENLPFKKYIVVFILAIFFAECSLNLSVKEIAFLIVGICVLVLCVYSLKATLYTLILASVAIPTDNQLLYVTGIKIASKNFKVIEIIFLCLFLSWFLRVTLKKLKIPELKKYLPFYLFFIYVVITAGFDVFINKDPQNTFLGVRFLLYYSIFFVFISEVKNPKEIKTVLNVIILGAIVHSLMAISMYFWPSNPLWKFILWKGADRANFRGIDTVILALAFTCTRFFLFPADKKVVNYICICLFIFALIISLYRVGWASFLIFIYLLIFLLLKKRKIQVKHVFLTMFLLPFIFIILTLGLNVTAGSHGLTGIEILSNRLSTFKNVEGDSSYTHRILMAQKDYQKVLDRPFFGTGYSDYYNELAFKKGEVFIDNTHMPLVRMIGLVGYSLFTWILIRFVKKLLYIFRHAEDAISTEFSFALVAFLPSMALISLTCAYLVAWDFTVVFAVLLAITEILADDLHNNKIIINRAWGR